MANNLLIPSIFIFSTFKVGNRPFKERIPTMTIQNIAFSSNFPKIMQNKTQKEVSFSGDPGAGLGSGNISDIELDEYTKVLRSGTDIENRKQVLEHMRNLLKQQKEEENTTKKLDTQG